MHRGIPPISPIIEPTRPTSEVSLSSSEFTGRQAKALFDFEPESESECALRTGDIIWVQYRQCQVSSRRVNAVAVWCGVVWRAALAWPGQNAWKNPLS